MDLLTILFGAVAGLVLGLTGAGGSVLAIPLLVYGLRWPFAEAVPVALLAVAMAAATGALLACRSRLVNVRAALVMAAFGALATLPGLHVARQLPSSLLLSAFATVMALVAWRLWRQASAKPAETAVVRAGVGEAGGDARIACEINPDNGQLRWSARCFSIIGGTGLLAGFLGGALGVGGGFVIVPALRAGARLGMHAAVATSLLAIALTSAAGATAAIARTGMPVAAAAPFVAGALAGMVAGRWLAPRVAGPALQRGFAFVMWLVAAFVVFDVLALH